MNVREYGMAEMDAAELTAVNGGDNPVLDPIIEVVVGVVKVANQASTWLVNQITN